VVDAAEIRHRAPIEDVEVLDAAEGLLGLVHGRPEIDGLASIPPQGIQPVQEPLAEVPDAAHPLRSGRLRLG